MLTVHHLASSQSERIVWLCEELELPYQLLRYERDPVSRLAPPNYKALHPFGNAIVDQNRRRETQNRDQRHDLHHAIGKHSAARQIDRQ